MSRSTTSPKGTALSPRTTSNVSQLSSSSSMNNSNTAAALEARVQRRRDAVLRSPFPDEASEQLYHVPLGDWLMLGNRAKAYPSLFASAPFVAPSADAASRVVYLTHPSRVPRFPSHSPQNKDEEKLVTANVHGPSSRWYQKPKPHGCTTLDCAQLLQGRSSGNNNSPCCSLPYSIYDPILSQIFLSESSVTELCVDAVVNAANEYLLGGAGVDGAVHEGAGPLLLRACAAISGCQPGTSVITKGFLLPSRAVIHTVAPRQPDEAVLRSCYQSVFRLAKHHKIQSIGFCCIGTGRYGYPMREATVVAMEETIRELKRRQKQQDTQAQSGEEGSVSSSQLLVSFSCFTLEELQVYREVLPEVYRRVMTTEL